LGKKLTLITGILVVLVITTLVFAGCYPAEEQAEGDFFSSIWPMIIFLGLFIALIYFTMIRPQRRRQKEHQHMVEELNRGERVITAGGIYGQIESVSEESIVIKVDSGASIRVARGSVVGKQVK
jgi:preprotein translocase subunit YajC